MEYRLCDSDLYFDLLFHYILGGTHPVNTCREKPGKKGRLHMSVVASRLASCLARIDGCTCLSWQAVSHLARQGGMAAHVCHGKPSRILPGKMGWLHVCRGKLSRILPGKEGWLHMSVMASRLASCQWRDGCTCLSWQAVSHLAWQGGMAAHVCHGKPSRILPAEGWLHMSVVASCLASCLARRDSCTCLSWQAVSHLASGGMAAHVCHGEPSRILPVEGWLHMSAIASHLASCLARRDGCTCLSWQAISHLAWQG